jgi:hypothetical protein
LRCRKIAGLQVLAKLLELLLELLHPALHVLNVVIGEAAAKNA